MLLDFPPPPASRLPRMLRLRDALTDGAGRSVTSLRVAVTDLCNLPCAHCPQEAPTQPLGRRELLQLVKTFTRLGIRQVRLSGGEPLLRRDLEILVAGISPEVEGHLHLATNGLRLARRARSLRDAGLSGVSVRLEAADRRAFQRLAGRDALLQVLAGVDAARAAGLPVGLTARVRRGWNEDQIVPLARLARVEGLPLRFTGMPVGSEFLTETIRDRLREAGEEGPDISAASPGDSCDQCGRVCLTSRGEVKPCLLGGPALDLAGALRNRASHEELVRLIRGALQAKRACPAVPEAAFAGALEQVGG
ncbi:radical SAM protein [Geothrix sp. 21YS21S-4]|uniref:radical SAM protein n=1 Tax=Geothrix sp. 21YS21S-4 TaxID=3068889 RepID=UPI0027B95E16|nr:GTP 3',8-cyclase MoaA [Geothrix sp. 21YS21S-4]